MLFLSIPITVREVTLFLRKHVQQVHLENKLLFSQNIINNIISICYWFVCTCTTAVTVMGTREKSRVSQYFCACYLIIIHFRKGKSWLSDSAKLNGNVLVWSNATGSADLSDTCTCHQIKWKSYAVHPNKKLGTALQEK